MYYCIVNPTARSGKGRDIWKKLKRNFYKKGIEYTAQLTKGPGHATELAEKLTGKMKDKNPMDLPVKIVVLGGDGTLNEVINGICDFDNTLLGYIPIGSSNDFARDLSYPKRTDDLIDKIVGGTEVRRLDLGRLTYNSMSRETSRLCSDRIKVTRIFDVSAGIGFDAAVCEQALSSGTKNFFNRIGLGKLTYGTIALRELFGAQKIPCSISIDGNDPIELEHFIFIAAMIHHFEGGGFNFAPNADLCDGKFDLVWAGNMPPARMLYALIFSFFGNYFWIKGVGYQRAEKVTIRTEKPMWVHTDGEVSVKSDHVTLECLKEKLRLMN